MSQDKFTQKASAAIQEAQQLAAINYHQELTTRHLLLALVKANEGMIAYILAQLSVAQQLFQANRHYRKQYCHNIQYWL